MMRGAAELLLGYFLVKVLARCDAEGEPPGQTLDSFLTVSLNNHSKDGENNGSYSESPLTEDMCRGYYDVMGQWDPPFVCRTGNYLYCCGTCGFRFCCAFHSSRLDQTNCGNYDTPPWMTTGVADPLPKIVETVVPSDALSSKDKSNLIVYVVCGIVAMMALIGIFTKLGLEKTHRPHRQNMSRVLAHVMRHPERSDDIGMHRQPYETMQTRGSVSSLLGSPMSNASPRTSIPQPYPTLEEITSPYELEPSQDVNKYASLKAVAARANENFYTSRRHTVDITAMSSLPMKAVDVEPEPSNPYSSPKQHAHKQNGRRHKGARRNTTATYGLTLSPDSAHLGKGWAGEAATVQWQTHVSKTHSASDNIDELYATRYMPPAQAYFISNSKTEVTV